jgi:2-polyprenyl-6-methoxyphenol hydroxylase-like FAD-dependent oxidoreductase
VSAERPIIIVGGGLGGLTAALALARHGQPARVLEGAPSFGAIGFGIQFGPNVFHVFDRIGVSDAVLEEANSPSAVLMIDAPPGKRSRAFRPGRRCARASSIPTSSSTASTCITSCWRRAGAIRSSRLRPTL